MRFSLLPVWKGSFPMLDFTFNVNPQLSEAQMADIKALIEDIKATISDETAQVAAGLVTKVAEAVAPLTLRIEELVAKLESSDVEKAALVDELNAIKTGIEGIFVPDQPSE